MRSLGFLATVVLLAAGSSQLSAQPLPPPVFEGPERIESTEGHSTVSWTVPEGTAADTFELISSRTEDFQNVKARYRGQDLASFVSGLPEGETWFRVRAIDEAGTVGAWSQPLVIEVAYASDSEVFRLLGLGTIVLIATVATILIGHRRKEGSIT